MRILCALPPELASLPNAKHMERALVHYQLHPNAWADAWTAARDGNPGRAWTTTRNTATAAARRVGQNTVWDALQEVMRDAVRCASPIALPHDKSQSDVWARRALENADTIARAALRGSLRALVTYDCAYLFDWPIERVRTHVATSEDPAAVLLLPAILALANERT